MTSPRIYTYKITFEEVPHYYYGVHKEKSFDEYYMGTPSTNKMYWEIYTPKKEILQFFDYTDEGWLEAQEEEKNLIREVFNRDVNCLNENCGGNISLKSNREGGKKTYKLGKGIHGFSKEEKQQISKKGGKKGGKKTYKLGIGIHGFSKEETIKAAKTGGKKAYELGNGCFRVSKEERQQISKKAGKKIYELGIGIHGLSKEEKSKNGKKAGKKTYKLGIGIHGLSKKETIKAAKKGAKTVHNQKWKCTITGHISSPGPLSNYQNKRGIDTKNRIRIH